MEPQAIFERLQREFGEQIQELSIDGPDPWIRIDPAGLVEIARFLKAQPDLAFDFLESVSGVDLKDRLQVVYHLLSYQHRHPLVLRVDVPYDQLDVPSVTNIWAAANWLEREQYDLFGVQFTGHPDLRRIMLPEDWEGYPLRKDYKEPKHYHGIETQRQTTLEQLKLLDQAETAETAKK